MTSSSFRTIVKILAVAASAVLMLGSASAQEIKRAKLGHSFTDAHPRAAAMKQFAAAVEKATGGKLAIDVFGSATLGSEDKMLIAVQSGTQDLYMGSLAPVSTELKERRPSWCTSRIPLPLSTSPELDAKKIRSAIRSRRAALRRTRLRSRTSCASRRRR